jgi:glycosyltransferase involved in cell wall biosynthesis
MITKVLLADICIVDGGVEHTVRSILREELTRADTSMAALLSPAEYNSSFIQDCRALAHPCIERSVLASIFFGARSTRQVQPTPALPPSTAPRSFSIRQKLLTRLKSIIPASVDNHIWHRRLAQRSVPVFRECYREIRPDVVHCRAGLYTWLAPAVMALEGLQPRPRIVFHLGCEPVLGTLPDFVVNTWLRADYMIYVSGPIQRLWESRYPRLKHLASNVIHHGLEIQQFPFEDRSSRSFNHAHPFRIGMCSRLTTAKGVDDAINAFARVHNAMPHTHLDIVGDGSEAGKLKQLTNHLGLQESVTFHGHQHDVLPYLRQFDLFLQPSRNEALGLSMMEAMATGLPIIATRVGGIPEVVIHDETGRLIDPGHVGALADEIHALINSPQKRLQFGIAARRRVERCFSIQRMCDDIHEVYRQILTT